MNKSKMVSTFGKSLLSRFSKKKYPFWVEIKLTSKCNLKCPFCDSWRREETRLDKKDVFNLIDQIEKDVVYVHLTGGEPLLREDIGEIIDYIQNKNGIYLSLITNGLLVKKKIKQIKRIDHLCISLEGPKEINCKLRGEGSYEKAVEAITIAKKNGIPTSINTILTKNNIDYADHILKICREHGIKCSMGPMCAHDMAVGVDRLNPEKQKYDLLMKKIMLTKDKEDIILSSKSCLNMIKDWPSVENMRCCAGRNFCFIDSDGKVYPCYNLQKKVKAKDFRIYGFREAFEYANKGDCSSCWGLMSIEANELLNYNIRTLWDKFRLIK